MPEMKLDYALVMGSDWHVGSGGGRHGAVDRLLERDGDGLPYVPASTLRGVWRDAAERLALGLDGGSTGKWQALVRRIFGGQPAQDGQPQRGCLILEDMRLPAALRTRVKEDARLREALTFVKPGVAIDAASGRARDDFLRFEEMGRAGTVLQAQGWLRLPDGVDAKDAEKVKAFLLAAALLVERIGGKRRRGAGRCRLHVRADGMTVASALELIEKAEEPPAWGNGGQAEAGGVNRQYTDAAGAGDWLEIPVLASVETPVIIPQQVMGNVVTTQDHIPGTYLLRHVAEALKAAGMDDPWAHVAAGDVQVLPLFPCNGKEARAVPMPMCLEAPKNDDSDEVRARNTLRTASEENPGTQFKGLKGGYIWPEDEGSLQWLRSVPQVLRTHNTVEDARQRPTEAVGGVFTFEAIASGIRLGGVLRINKAVVDGLDLNEEALRNKLAATLHVGRASRMGYGRIRLEAGEEGEAAAINASSGDLVLLLTSDLILPGEALGGATHLAAIIDAVEQALGMQDLFDREQARAHLAVRRIEGWQQRWGLPRPTLVAIAAGSVIRLPLAEGKALDDAMLQRLAAGLGERRGEGFGQVMVNPPFLQHAELTVGKADDDDDAITISEDAAGASEVDAEIANALQRFEKLVEEAAWRTAIIEAAEAVAADTAQRKENLGWGDSKPGSSQLGVLRTLLLAVPGDGAEAASTLHKSLKSWVKHVKSKDGAADRWGGKDVLNTLLTLTNPQQSEIWEVLRDGLEGEDWPGTLTSQMEGLKKRLHLFAVRTFLLRAMHHHRRMLESAGKQADDGNRNRRQEQQEEVAS